MFAECFFPQFIIDGMKITLNRQLFENNILFKKKSK